uniref:Uncharacterized protein n=1 Tax=Arundo donax TaxID=35708 RepID=A0A0A8ZQV6_ARUDO
MNPSVSLDHFSYPVNSGEGRKEIKVWLSLLGTSLRPPWPTTYSPRTNMAA